MLTSGGRGLWNSAWPVLAFKLMAARLLVTQAPAVRQSHPGSGIGDPASAQLFPGQQLGHLGDPSGPSEPHQAWHTEDVPPAW